jgi:hypothetical protein
MIHDLDNVLISERIEASWLAYLQFAIADLQAKYPDLKSSEIPDEQLRELPNGNAEIFVIVRGSEIKMAVPRNEWKFK